MNVDLLYSLILANLRPPATWASDDTTGTASYTFSPPLSSAEQATLNDITTMANFSVDMTLAEWQAVKSDAASLKAYYGLASPTNAQSVAAIKSIIKVLSVIVRS